jgi:hypothetical protein
MDVSDLANIAGALITAALGLMGLVRPAAAATFTSMSPVGKLGVSEIRATYGGLFLFMGVFALIVHEPLAYQVLGWAWVGAAAGRAVSVVVDASRESKNFGGIAFEGVIGALLLIP